MPSPPVGRTLGMPFRRHARTGEQCKELECLQCKVQYLENQIFVLKLQRTKSTNDILRLIWTINELESSLAQKKGGSGIYGPGIRRYCQASFNYPAKDALTSLHLG